LRHRESFLDFGARFAYNDSDAHQGKSSEGEKNGQENLEEGKKAGSNEAVEVWKKVTRPRLWIQERATRAARS
jgi:hypothetical protein